MYVSPWFLVPLAEKYTDNVAYDQTMGGEQFTKRQGLGLHSSTVQLNLGRFRHRHPDATQRVLRRVCNV
jgi:hypothetical protein